MAERIHLRKRGEHIGRRLRQARRPKLRSIFLMENDLASDHADILIAAKCRKLAFEAAGIGPIIRIMPADNLASAKTQSDIERPGKALMDPTMQPDPSIQALVSSQHLKRFWGVTSVVEDHNLGALKGLADNRIKSAHQEFRAFIINRHKH